MHLFNHSLLPSSFDELFVRNATLYGNLYFMRNLNDFYVLGVRAEFLPLLGIFFRLNLKK